MSWFKVDDTFAFHAKTVAAGNAAVGLWVRAGAWASQQLTDGYVPDHIATALGRPAEAARLVDVGLWTREDEGYRFWQWAERNPSREQVEGKRQDARDRMRRARTVRANTEDCSRELPANSARTSPEQTRERSPTPTRPDPTRPEEQREPQPPPSVAPSTASFEAWWDAYPRKVGKRTARTAWERACRREDPHVVLAATEHFRDDPNRDPAFTPHPATWLNRDGWADEPCQPRNRRPNRAEERDRRHLALIEHFRDDKQGEIA